MFRTDFTVHHQES